MANASHQRSKYSQLCAWAALSPVVFALGVLPACVPEAEQVLGQVDAVPNGTAEEQVQAEDGDERRSSVVQRRMQGPPERRNPDRRPDRDDTRFPDEIRTIDATGNNVNQPDWGAAGAAFQRIADAAYSDGVEAVVKGRPNARAISQAIFDQTDSVPNAANASDFVWQWGQLIDHDITETPIADPAEEFDIAVPIGDPWFDPDATGVMQINLDRSAYVVESGVRQQFNAITAYIDASHVYGSDEERAAALRTLDGTGRMLTSAGDLLPFNTAGLHNAPSDHVPTFFLAGDIRANEQVGLTAMHTLFVREHNYWADRIREEQPALDGEQVYETARAIVAAETQVITYREFLPALLGPDALRPYRGYRPDVDAGISNEFATAAYRFGHSMLSSQLLRLDENGNEIDGGHLSLAAAFFVPGETIAWGIEPVLRGLSAQVAQQIDAQVIDDVRNFLFGAPGAGGFDLVSLNIQRGRDHGLPTLNEVRVAMGLEPYVEFAGITGDVALQQRLGNAYLTVDQVDLWVGGLAEDHVGEALVGETFRAILVDQFERLRDGDRFWYRGYLPRDMADMVESQTLADVIRRNTEIGAELPDDVFHVRVVEAELVPGEADAADAVIDEDSAIAR